MFFIEDVARLLFWLLLAILLVNGLFLWFVLERRLTRQRYFLVKDAARQGLRHHVIGFAAGGASVEDMLALRPSARTRAVRDALHELLFDVLEPGNAARISELLIAFRSVDEWARQAFGRRRGPVLVARAIRREPPAPAPPRSFLTNVVRRLRVFAVPRALAVSRLSRLAPEFAQVFLVEAAADPAREVRLVAVAGMGRSRHPPLVPYLVGELERSVTDDHDVSWHTVKIALTSFRLGDLHAFVPFLAHPHPRVRLILIDVVRQIAGEAAREGKLNKNDFSPELYATVLDRLVADESADVRARSATVVAHFRDQRAVRALRRLLTDGNDFVRLHAVRAAADRFYADLIPEIARRLRDPHWRVRDAAVRAMLSFGAAGLDTLFRVFLESDDEETGQQITDGLQRAGAMPTLLTALGTAGLESTLAGAVCQKMALLGKTVYLHRAISSIDDDTLRLGLMDALEAAPDEEYVQVLQALASGPQGAVASRASDILRQSGILGADGGAPRA